MDVAYPLPKFKNKFLCFMKGIWNQQHIPKHWGIAPINALWRQNYSSKNPNTNRCITTGSNMVKILMNIVLTRLSLFYENQLLTIQFRFLSGKGCNDDIFVIILLSHLHEIVNNPNRKVYILYIYLKVVYSHINRDFLHDKI